MNTTPALEISALEKHDPRFALGPVDLTVPNGTIFGLIGPNGAGKTTLIDQVFGMGSPDAGTIRVCGLDHARDEVAVKERAAYVGPDLSYLVWGKVGKAIRFIRGFRPSWDEAYCCRLMDCTRPQRERPHRHTLLWRGRQIRPAPRARLAPTGLGARRTDHRSRCALEESDLHRVALHRPR